MVIGYKFCKAFLDRSPPTRYVQHSHQITVVNWLVGIPFWSKGVNLNSHLWYTPFCNILNISGIPRGIFRVNPEQYLQV